MFLVQLTTGRTGNLTRLILTLAICVAIHVDPHIILIQQGEENGPWWYQSDEDLCGGVKPGSAPPNKHTQDTKKTTEVLPRRLTSPCAETDTLSAGVGCEIRSLP